MEADRGVIVDLRRGRPARLLLAAAVALLALAGVAGLLRWLYPLPYVPLIVAEAGRNGLDPLLVAAVIRVESRFRPDATSSVGARGLMQILPETGRWVAGRIGLRTFHPDQLFQPEVNVAVGTWYLAYLRTEFGGNLAAALAAYNGGRHNVRAWLKSGRWDGTVSGAGAIPFPETRYFVRAVMRDWRIYRWLYGTPRP